MPGIQARNGLLLSEEMDREELEGFTLITPRSGYAIGWSVCASATESYLVESVNVPGFKAQWHGGDMKSTGAEAWGTTAQHRAMTPPLVIKNSHNEDNVVRQVITMLGWFVIDIYVLRRTEQPERGGSRNGESFLHFNTSVTL